MTVKAIFFDAVGTLIHPEPSAAVAYAEVGARFGTHYTVKDIRGRFRSAFRLQEEIDRENGWQTSEERERQRWHSIVTSVLDDVDDGEACFQLLYEHFAQPHAWRVAPAASTLLDHLKSSGRRLGMASNYDHRLHSVIEAFPALSCIEYVVISAEVGWRKPAAPFFAAVCRVASLPAEEILFIGDDRTNDYEGALAAGLQAVLVSDEAELAALRMKLGGLPQ